MSGQITERMENVKSDLEQEFTNLYCKKDFEYQLQLAKKSASSRKPQVLKKLADMYNEVGVDCKYDQPLSYYEKLFSKLQVCESVADVNNKIINMMNSLYTEYPKPEEFMERIVNRLDPDTMLSGSLQLRILRRFLQTINIRGIKGNYKYYSSSLAKQIKEEGIYSIGEEIFKVLDNKPEGKCDYFQLVHASHNLAHGIFISPFATKEILFLFAFAYGMKYYPSQEQADYDVTRDVEKNLFVDYYCDNLTRFLVTDTGALSGISDKEPSGTVINPKNFVDTVFVYFLNQENLSASEKVIGFYAATKDIKESWEEQKGFIPEIKSKYENVATTVYKSHLDETFFVQDVNSMKAFILDQYYCDARYTYGNNRIGTKGIFELPFTTNTAYEQYNNILSLLREEMALPSDFEFKKAFDSYDGRVFENDKVDSEDKKYKKKHGEFDLEKYEQDAEKATNKQWRQLCENSNLIGLLSLNENLPIIQDTPTGFQSVYKTVIEKIDPKKALTITDSNNVTRTKLIAAYYHFYVWMMTLNDVANTWRSFKDIYDDFSSCIADYLTDAGYQEISSKNLFDMLVIFSAYCKVNGFLS